MKKETTFAIYIVNKVISLLTHKEFLKPERKKNVKPKIMVKERKKNFMHACMFCHSVISNSLQLMECSPADSSVQKIFQARTLEWVAIFFFRGSSQPRDQTQVSHIAGTHFTV